MRTKSLLLFTLVITVLLNVSLFSQVQYRAYVKNQTLALTDPTYGACIYFDLYLLQNGTEPMYLADADFKFTFNVANFSGATIEYVDESNELFNSNGASTVLYNTGISPAFLAPNKLSISVQPPGFTNQIQFDSRVAKIDAVVDKHKLGQFVVYNISNTGGTFGLTWLTGTGGTVATSFANATPWPSSPAVGSFDPIDPAPLPVELNSFTAVGQGRDVELNWATKTEVNSSKFFVERKAKNNESWVKVGEVAAAGNSNSVNSYAFTDMKLQSGKYIYRLKMVDADGSYRYSNEVEAEVSLPKEYAISQNYPNPFNPNTRVDYQLPFDSKVSLDIYGITGEKVATVLNSELAAGYYTVEINAGTLNLASGVYVYRISATGSNNQNFVQVKKLLLTK